MGRIARTALPRSLLTTTLRCDPRCGNGPAGPRECAIGSITDGPLTPPRWKRPIRTCRRNRTHAIPWSRRSGLAAGRQSPSSRPSRLPRDSL